MANSDFVALCMGIKSFSIEDELEYKISLLKVGASGDNYVCCGSVLSFGLNFIFLCLGYSNV